MKELKYGKAKGLVLLNKYLPKINPFKTVSIIRNEEEWNNVKNKYPERITIRTDTLIGDTKNVRIDGAAGKKAEVPGIMKEVKRQNPNGVVLLLEVKSKQPQRYENDGGFNIIFNMDESIIIELVGKGFDAREITREKAVHERYVIPWNEILFLKNKKDIMKNELVSKYIVNEEEYKRTRKERMEFLSSIYEISENIEKEVPDKYTKLNDDFIEQILNDIVFELYKKENELKKDGLNHFGVQGNIVNNRPEAWEIFRAERLISNKENVIEKDMEENER